MSKRFKALIVGGASVVGLALTGMICRYAPESGGPDRDEFVRQTKATLESIATPEEAEAAITRCGTVRFPNGEWVTGVGVDSHSWLRAKNTLVVRDSRGVVSAFVGHVCGPDWMPRYFPKGHPDFPALKSFYAFLKEAGFKPYSVETE